MSKSVPNRLFDPGRYIKKATRTVKLPSGLILPDNKREISNLALYKGKDAYPIEDTIVVIIHGACREGGTRNAEATHGVWFANDSRYNDSGFFEDDEEQTLRLGEIGAAVRALQTIEDHISGIRLVVLMTDSDDLTGAISEDIWLWNWNPKRDEFRDQKNRTVPDSNAFKTLHETLLRLEKSGVKVKFWKVDSEHVKCARDLALSAFSDDDDDDDDDNSNASEKENKMLGKPCYEYLIHKAPKSSEVRKLAREMNLDLPDKHTRGLKLLAMYPVRRLVLTGNDTRRNFDSFFGLEHDEELRKIWEMARRSVLRSQLQKDGGKDKWFGFEVSPFAVKPRPATAGELKVVKEHIAHMKKK